VSEPAQGQGNAQGIDLQDMLILAERYVRGMWRYRWLALAAAWVATVAGWLFVYRMPDTYQASAQVFVDTDNLLRPLLRGLAVETDVLSDVAVMSRTVMARPNLERVLRETDLDITAKSTAQYETLLASLQERIGVVPSRENIYTITFADSDRARALRVVDELLDSFVEDTLGTGAADSEQAETALGAELKDYERRLVEAEDRLKEFKRQNVGFMPNEHGDYYAQLQNATAELAAIQQDLRIAQQKLIAVDGQLEGEEPVFGIMSSPMMGGVGQTPYDMQISTLEGNIANLTVEFTEKHPEVVRTKSRLEELYKQRDEYKAAMPAESFAAMTSPLDLNPVYQNLKIQRSTLEVDIASGRARLAEKSAEVKRLQESVNVIPQVEAELNRLNRDYDVVKQRYAEMLRRWEDLQTAKRVQTGVEQVRFRIINPPFVPSKPSGPPRMIFLGAALALGLGVGGALAFLLNLLSPVYHSSREVLKFNLPILGSVGRAETGPLMAQRMRARWAVAGGFAALLVCTGLAIAFAEAGARVVQSLI
jgi:polysaccharide chain length determinant protein (PEP-CTERM system associated)